MLYNNGKLESIEGCYTTMQLMLRGLYLEYVNDYVGYTLMAEHKGISEPTMLAMLEEGRTIHESIAEQYKQAID